MALFSKRTNSDGSDGDAAVAGDTAAQQPSDDAGTDAAASVGISVSSYRGMGATPATAPSAGTAPAAESVPGIKDNVVLREALAGLPESPSVSEILDVARQLLQGHLFLRVKGDARELLAAGKDLPVAVVTLNGKQFVLVYSSGTALRASIQADSELGTSAMGQPVRSVIRYVLGGTYAGIVVDHASAPARAVIPRELLEKLVEQGDPTFELKTLLAGERTSATASALVDALTRAKFWVAVNQSAGGPVGVAEARTVDGDRLVELYSHPLEVASRQRGDRAAPMTAAQLAAALRADEDLAGVIVDPGGPWMRLSRAQLAPILDLPA
ncbi:MULTISPECIES: SseB family protein [unclassified Microbacterium]|uniref:SseB family protein n=1 Tax=unclassified Microbacterium TaxID=2609290 RepID=UPI00214C46F9|nr:MULTISPECIES: SseB family protein [unclassified Microbacterium]MCR2809018.1 SseB family protein [Microbacterium sp. zg.B185]WIM18572.1 SseB family protein [Microbacterium sp. zg-B185]